jgi:translocation and assembly module TamB
MQISGQADGSGRTSLAGEFRTRKGEGHIEGLIDLSKPLDPSVQIDVSGEDLVLFDSNDLRLVTHPDFRLAWYGAALHVDGQVVIPSARLAPSVLPAPRVVESPDVVIVAGTPPQSQATNGKPRRIDVFGQLDVVVGNDVEVDLSVAEADVSGQARFEWNGPAIPLANGGFNLSGLVLAFGQRLEITEGRIGFPGVPADNPHLNIRAEREIYGNSEVRRAGLWVTGTLRRPQLEPYTTPMTTRERAQTLLVTGSDFNMERGSGAVSVGTYIAPRVFVSYGIGVFDESSVISVRYDLGRGWGIMGTSGERQTGVDVSYTIER